MKQGEVALYAFTALAVAGLALWIGYLLGAVIR